MLLINSTTAAHQPCIMMPLDWIIVMEIDLTHHELPVPVGTQDFDICHSFQLLTRRQTYLNTRSTANDNHDKVFEIPFNSQIYSTH